MDRGPEFNFEKGFMEEQHTAPSVSNHPEIEKILRDVNYVAYKAQRDHIVGIAEENDFSRRFRGYTILEQMFQNELKGEKDLWNGLGFEQRAFLEGNR